MQKKKKSSWKKWEIRMVKLKTLFNKLRNIYRKNWNHHWLSGLHFPVKHCCKLLVKQRCPQGEALKCVNESDLMPRAVFILEHMWFKPMLWGTSNMLNSQVYADVWDPFTLGRQREMCSSQHQSPGSRAKLGCETALRLPPRSLASLGILRQGY